MSQDDTNPIADGAEPRADESKVREDSTVPLWVALTLLAALFVAAGAGGYYLRGLMGERPSDVAQVTDSEIAKWTAAVRRDSDDIPARLALAYAYQVDRQWDLALKQYDYVIRRDPGNTAALYQQGVIYIDLGLGKEAEVSLWKVLDLEPEHVQAASALGRYYVGLEQYRSVATVVRPAVLAHPDSAELQYLIGLAYEKLGERQWAVDRYRLALQAAPDFTEAHAGLLRLGAESTD